MKVSKQHQQKNMKKRINLTS